MANRMYSVPEPSRLRREDVWGERRGDDPPEGGMVVYREGDDDLFFGDEVPMGSVTVVCNQEDLDEVTYWLEEVQGPNCRILAVDHRLAISRA